MFVALVLVLQFVMCGVGDVCCVGVLCVMCVVMFAACFVCVV